ncbi:cytidylate kinase [Bacilli bacterium PM5-3]|nr:cytidylate kinase [Bacilli bacterium PM5-3]MDH6603761.1 cytidylate kinase [Bacilli bacterium PM5-9]
MDIKEIIAIDGPAASGKSTVAKLVAKKLGYKYIDSGAMYRCVALYALENSISIDDIANHLDDIKIEFDVENNVYLNNENVSMKIRTNEVTALVPKIAKIELVREKLVEMQQSFGLEKGIVMDGRDIGTVVFKDAKVKIYQVASAKARALRRYNENIANGIKSNLSEIEAEIEKRDHDDINRDISPLTKASDAIEVDTSNYSIEENVEKVLEIFKEKVK